MVLLLLLLQSQYDCSFQMCVQCTHQKANLITSIIKFCGHTLDTCIYIYLGIPFVRRAFTFNILVQLSRAHLGYCQKQNEFEKKMGERLTRNLIKQIKSYTSNTYERVREQKEREQTEEKCDVDVNDDGKKNESNRRRKSFIE